MTSTRKLSFPLLLAPFLTLSLSPLSLSRIDRRTRVDLKRIDLRTWNDGHVYMRSMRIFITLSFSSHRYVSLYCILYFCYYFVYYMIFYDFVFCSLYLVLFILYLKIAEKAK